MEYFAANHKLSKLLNNQRLLQQHFGTMMTNQIIHRLDEFNAAKNLAQIPIGPPSYCHSLKGNLQDKFSVHVSKNFRMIFEGYDENDQLTTDKSAIVTISILSIKDYH